MLVHISDIVMLNNINLLDCIIIVYLPEQGIHKWPWVDILPSATMANTIRNIRLITEAKTNPCYWVLSTLTCVLLLYRFLGLPYIYFLFAKLRLYFHSITIHLSNVLVVSSTYHAILCQYYGCFIISPLTSVQTGTQQVCISSPSLHSLIWTHFYLATSYFVFILSITYLTEFLFIVFSHLLIL